MQRCERGKRLQALQDVRGQFDGLVERAAPVNNAMTDPHDVAAFTERLEPVEQPAQHCLQVGRAAPGLISDQGSADRRPEVWRAREPRDLA